MDNLIAQSPLDENNAARFENAAVVLEEIPVLGMVRLQGPAQDSAFCEHLASLLMPLPAAGKTTTAVTDSGIWRCLWLAPNEWLFVVPTGDEAQLLNGLAPALAGKPTLATLISDSRLAISIRGSRAMELLSKGCALDLHPRQFSVGQTAVTRFAKIAGLLTCIDETGFELYVDRSYAHYLWQWLVDAAGEFA
jgi:sarcosine oxidase, subunit gamma